MIRRTKNILPVFLIAVLAVCFMTLPALSSAAEVYPETPEGVVAGYVKENFSGSETYSDTMAKYTTWVDGPGWDHSYLIKDFRIKTVKIQSDSADVIVEYLVAGVFEVPDYDSPALDASEAGKKTTTFKVVKKNGQWKILKPQEAPHIDMIRILDSYKRTDKPSPAMKQVVIQIEKSMCSLSWEK